MMTALEGRFMYCRICTIILAICLILAMAACAKEMQEPTEVFTVMPTTETVTEPAAVITEPTDPRLLETTGGIVQGMSGSPIIQDGKLVGAVTHVLVNDPTTGYGIFIENMLDAAA